MRSLRLSGRLWPFGGPRSPKMESAESRESVWRHKPHIVRGGFAGETPESLQILPPADWQDLIERREKGLRNGEPGEEESVFERSCASPKMRSCATARGCLSLCDPNPNRKLRRGRPGHQRASSGTRPTRRLLEPCSLRNRPRRPGALIPGERGDVAHTASRSNLCLRGRLDKSAR